MLKYTYEFKSNDHCDKIKILSGPFILLNLKLDINIQIDQKNNYIFQNNTFWNPKIKVILLKINNSKNIIKCNNKIKINILKDFKTEPIFYVNFLECYFQSLKEYFNSSKDSLNQLIQCEEAVIKLILNNLNTLKTCNQL